MKDCSRLLRFSTFMSASFGWFPLNFRVPITFFYENPCPGTSVESSAWLYNLLRVQSCPYSRGGWGFWVVLLPHSEKGTHSSLSMLSNFLLVRWCFKYSTNTKNLSGTYAHNSFYITVDEKWSFRAVNIRLSRLKKWWAIASKFYTG